jgi:hypothetical protein
MRIGGIDNYSGGYIKKIPKINNLGDKPKENPNHFQNSADIYPDSDDFENDSILPPESVSGDEFIESDLYNIEKKRTEVSEGFKNVLSANGSMKKRWDNLLRNSINSNLY